MDNYSVHAEIIELIRIPDKDMTIERFQTIDGIIYERGEDGWIGKKGYSIYEISPDYQFKTKSGANNKIIDDLTDILSEINDVLVEFGGYHGLECNEICKM